MERTEDKDIFLFELVKGPFSVQAEMHVHAITYQQQVELSHTE